ncbi:SAM-dependent methyltransferase [Parasphingorhabdus pacifica]
MSVNQQWDISSGVGITALAVSAVRAMESTRPDALINDPFAAPLVEAANTPLPTPEAGSDEFWQSAIDYIAVRSRFFDEFFEAADGAGQAVILAAGLDSRPFRLTWPEGLRLYEIDQPRVLEFKDEVLQGLGGRPARERHAIPVDLREDWSTALKEAGFDPALPTAWLAEGLLPYLPADAERNLLNTVHAFSAPGSSVAIEQISRNVVHEVEQLDAAREAGIDLAELFSSEDRPAPGGTLRGLGWTVRERSAEEVGRHYGRELDGVIGALGNANQFLTATLSS